MVHWFDYLEWAWRRAFLVVLWVLFWSRCCLNVADDPGDVFGLGLVRSCFFAVRVIWVYEFVCEDLCSAGGTVIVDVVQASRVSR